MMNQHLNNGSNGNGSGNSNGEHGGPRSAVAVLPPQLPPQAFVTNTNGNRRVSFDAKLVVPPAAQPQPQTVPSHPVVMQRSQHQDLASWFPHGGFCAESFRDHASSAAMAGDSSYASTNSSNSSSPTNWMFASALTTGPQWNACLGGGGREATTGYQARLQQQQQRQRMASREERSREDVAISKRRLAAAVGASIQYSGTADDDDRDDDDDDDDNAKPMSSSNSCSSSITSASALSNINSTNTTNNTDTNNDTKTKKTRTRKKKSASAKSRSRDALEPPLTEPVSEKFLVNELNDLSIEERQQVYEDVHGVHTIRKETPEFLAECLDKMQKELNRILASASLDPIGKTDRQIYERASFYCPKLVRDASLRKMFLRCDEYNAELAAVRYIRYWSFHYDMVDGDWDMILKPCGMTQDDLLSVDDFLHRGFLHILPNHDQSGRMIMTFFNRRCMYNTSKDLMRVFLYIAMQALRQNVNAQIHGVVGIAYECVKGEDYVVPFDLVLIKMASRFYKSVPIKYRAFHFCYDDPKMAPVISLVQMLLGRKNRIRFRSHFGTDTENRWKLMTFGIPIHSLPVFESNSHIDMSSCNAFLDACRERQQQQLMEGADKSSIIAAMKQIGHEPIGIEDDGAVDYPTSRDVLAGKGKTYQEHPGNRRLNTIIADHWEMYHVANRTQKIAMFHEILRGLQNNGTRFLKKRKKTIAGTIESEWFIMDDKKALDKVSHAFRNKPIIDKYHETKNKKTNEEDSPESASPQQQQQQ